MLLYYFMVFLIFYIGRAISKRYARSAVKNYNIQPVPQIATAIDMQNFNQVPDEESQRNRYNDGAVSPKPIFEDTNLVTQPN